MAAQASAVLAQNTSTVYRCVGADGKTVLQQSPCAGPAPTGDARRVEGALRNARDDQDLVATINACRGVDKSSSSYGQCNAVLLCVERGLVGPSLRACISRARVGYANEQRVWLELKRQEEEETKAMTSPDSPASHLSVGKVFVGDDLAKVVDAKFPGAEWYADQSIGIPYRNGYFLVQAEKLSASEGPVRYRIASMSRLKRRPDKVAMSISGRPQPSLGAPTTQSSPGLPAVSCDSLRDFAELEGHGFVARGALVTAARDRGLCQ